MPCEGGIWRAVAGFPAQLRLAAGTKKLCASTVAAGNICGAFLLKIIKHFRDVNSFSQHICETEETRY